MYMSASFPWMNWNEEIGFPNWILSLAYRRLSSRQARCEPREQPLRVIRSVQRPLVRIAPPRFNPPIRFPSGISMSSKVISAVGELRMPHFLIFSR